MNIARAAAGLVLATVASTAFAAPDDETASSRERAMKERQAAIARCAAQRGIDCNTEDGLRVWLLQERSRAGAIRQGSRSIHQRVDRPQEEAK